MSPRVGLSGWPRGVCWLVVPLSLCCVAAGCSRSTVIRTSPQDAHVSVDDEGLRDNSFQYSRGLGKTYRLRVEAPGYVPEERELEVNALGELPSNLYIELRPVETARPAVDSRKRGVHITEAVTQLTNDLLNQVKRARASEHKSLSAKLVVDPIIDSDTGEVFEITRSIERLMRDEARRSFPAFDVTEMSSRNIDRADYVIAGIFPLELYDDAAGKLRHLTVSVLDRKSGDIVAHADVWLAEEGMTFELTPTYRDSPMYLMDERVDALIATARSTVGSRANEEYFNSLHTSALIAEASSAYDRGDYVAALGLFAKAAERPDGRTMKVQSGLYQSYFKTKNSGQAENALDILIAQGMQRGHMGLKFMFNVNATEFFGQANDLQRYDIWLRAIAKNILSSAKCVQVVGHASRSGTHEHNKILSENRASTIYRKLQTEVPGVEERTSHLGRGDSENVVGTGANDQTDAIDRRVEFKVMQCGTE